MYGMMYPSPDKMMSSMNPKGGSGPGGGGIVGGPGSGLPGTNCFSGRYSPTYRVPDQMRDPMRRCMTNTPAVSHTPFITLNTITSHSYLNYNKPKDTLQFNNVGGLTERLKKSMIPLLKLGSRNCSWFHADCFST